MAEKAADFAAAGTDAEARPWQSYHTVFTNAKAGMEGVDKEKVQRVVYEMTKGSKYFENQERKEAESRQKIERMRSQCEKLSAVELAHHQTIADKRLVELEATRDFTKTWLHVDMDAFYAAVETLSDPTLEGKPMAVGSISMISTANYEARRFGVRAAMPGFIARKLCPGLIFVPTDFKKYTYYSDLTRKVFQKYDPNFLAASLDEAYLDITGVCKERNMPGEEIAEELRAAVFEETSGLTCSAGVAPNHLLAKVCSDINKPNGQFILPNDRTAVMTFISSLPIRKIGGIGKVTENILRDVFGIKTCEDMLQKSGYLYAFFSRPTADFFLSVGLGLGKTDTPEVRMRKSISNERTFSATGDEALLYQRLAELAEMLSIDMHKEGLHGRTLTLKLKNAAFEVRTRAITLERYICSSEDIMKHASKLLKAELPASLRLIGLRLSHFKEDKLGAPTDPTQKTLRSFIREGSSLCSDTNDRCFTDDMVTDFSIDSHEINPHGLGRQSGLIDASDTNDKNCTSHSAAGIGLTDHKHEESNISEPLREVGGSHSLGEAKQRHNDEEPSSFHQEEQFIWLNDYMCSLCGIELPPSFTEERQEHYDYHLAEKLQKEESSSAPSIHMPKQRSAPRDQSATTSRPISKKRKKSPMGGGHLPIHLFFGKTNQNF